MAKAKTVKKAGQKLRVTQTKSGIGFDKQQSVVLRSLGLRRLHHTVEVPDNPAIRGMLGKVSCQFDPEIEAEFPANMSGKVTIRARGKDYVRKVVVPKGEPDNFLTEAERRAKCAGLTDAGLGADRAAKLAGLPEWAWGPLPPGPDCHDARNAEIKALRAEGVSLGAIGERYGLTRQRIHQIVTRGR